MCSVWQFFFFFYQEKLGNFCESKQISIKGWLLNIDTIIRHLFEILITYFLFFFQAGHQNKMFA